MTAANELIERLERETGQRIDANDGDNLAMAGLIGALSRLLGQSPPAYRERDDVVAGLLIRHQMSAEGARQRQSDAMLADMIRNGVSPDSLADLPGHSPNGDHP